MSKRMRAILLVLGAALVALAAAPPAYAGMPRYTIVDYQVATPGLMIGRFVGGEHARFYEMAYR